MRESLCANALDYPSFSYDFSFDSSWCISPLSLTHRKKLAVATNALIKHVLPVLEADIASQKKIAVAPNALIDKADAINFSSRR